MEKIKMKIHACLALVLLWVTGPVSAIPSLVYDGSDITGVSGLIIDGEEWDMTLHDGSYYELSVNQGIDLVARDSFFAYDATLALYTWMVNTDPLELAQRVDMFVGCSYLYQCNIVTVWNDATNVVLAHDSLAYTYARYHYIANTGHDKMVDYNNRAYASWIRASVPEPSIAILMASGLLAFRVVRRKRKA